MLRCTILSLLAATLVASPALAQSDPGAILANATIQLPPVTGSGIQNLDFGDLVPGATGDVTPGPSGGPTSSAGWRFSGIRKGRLLLWTFTLPTALVRGTDAIPVDWNNANYGTSCVSNGGGCLVNASFNPANPGFWRFMIIPNNTPGNNFDVTVYAGARVTIPPVPPGVYNASVRLTMAYLF
jgi:hypothetical protein